MTSILGALFWALLALAQFVAGLLMRAFLSIILWLFWPVIFFYGLLGFLIATAQSAEAGWFSWLWGSDTRHLERSLAVAQEAARVASQAAEAQAQQAEAHAQQNARLAETLGQLSSERTNLADHISALTVLGLKDSQWAAALSATGPVLVCITVLLVAGLALWLVNRAGEGRQEELAATVDLLVEEISAHVTEPVGVPVGPYGARGGSIRLGEHRRKHSPHVALVGYAGEELDDTSESKQDSEPEDERDGEQHGNQDREPMPF
jgi:hypothetical protein